MSIITILFALLVSGSGYVSAHPGDVLGGGPTGHSQPSPGVVGGVTVNDVYGGGPVS